MYKLEKTYSKQWSKNIKDILVAQQDKKDACNKGSWSPTEFQSKKNGRVYSTSLAIMTLEIYNYNLIK